MRNRKPLRLKDYDYSQDGCYFVTICTKDRINYFGEIIDGKMELNDYGKIAEKLWKGISNQFSNIILDEFVIMPNHIHGIIMIINDFAGNPSKEKSLKAINAKSNTNNDFPKNIPKMYSLQKTEHRSKMLLSKIIQAYKKTVSIRINNVNKKSGIKINIWHKSFYDHIIRNGNDLQNTQAYIFYNPVKWEFDKENLNNK